MDSLEKPIANIEELHAGINILKLFKGHIDVSRITLEGGNFNLIQNVDSSYNFIEAFSPSETDHSIHKQPKPSEPNNSNKFSKSEMDLSINQVYFKNVALNYHSKLSRKSAVAKIDVLKASFEYMPEIIKTTCRLQMDITDLQLSDQKIIQIRNMRLHNKIGVIPIIT